MRSLQLPGRQETETVPARIDARFRGGMAATAKVNIGALKRRLEQNDLAGKW